MNVQTMHLKQINARMADACMKAGRNQDDVALLAVSKNHPADSVRILYQSGQRAFGENRLQEALRKQRELEDLGIQWHFIGPVQSNKTRDIARHFDWVQSADREKVLRRLSAQRPDDIAELNICLQINIDDEPQKAGLEPGQVQAMASLVRALPGLCLRGLMSIPRQTDDLASTRASFAALHGMFLQLQETDNRIDTLSMGMSSDLEAAIAEGSTMVRVGTDLFGSRN